MKVPHVQIRVPLLEQAQHFLRLLQPHPLGARPPTTPVQQPVIPVRLVAPFPASHTPVRDPQDLCRLPPSDPLGHGSQNYFAYFHCPLPGGLSISLHSASH